MMTAPSADSEAALDKVHTPTLIIWGRDDMLIPMSMGERFNKGIAGSKMAIIEDTGHIPMVGKPEQFDKEVTAFLTAPQTVAGEQPVP